MPRRVGRELRPLAEGGFACRRIAVAPREDLEGQPRARPFRGGCVGNIGRLARRLERFGQARRHVAQVRRLEQKRADTLVGRRRRRHHAVDQSTEVPQAATLFEQAHQAFEWLAKARVCGVGGEVVACRARIVTLALLTLADLGEEPRLARWIRRRRHLRAQPPHRLCELREGFGRGGTRRSRRQRLRGQAERVRLGHARSRGGRPLLSRTRG